MAHKYKRCNYLPQDTMEFKKVEEKSPPLGKNPQNIPPET